MVSAEDPKEIFIFFFILLAYITSYLQFPLHYLLPKETLKILNFFLCI